MKRLDAEIFEVENRIVMRKRAIEREAAVARSKASQKLASPVVLAGAAALGFVAARSLGPQRRRARRRKAVQETKEQGKGFALGTLLMTGVTWVIRTQFGGPVGLAQFVIGKLKERDGRPAATAAPAQIPR